MEVVLKGSSIADLGLVAAAQGDLLIGDATPKFIGLTLGSSGKVLTAGAATATWETPTPKVGAAAGNLLMAGATPFTYANFTAGAAGKVLQANGVAAALTWESAGTGDFKADGSVAMTDALKLKSNAGEGGMTTTDGAIFFDTTANKIKVYVA